MGLGLTGHRLNGLIKGLKARGLRAIVSRFKFKF